MELQLSSCQIAMYTSCKTFLKEFDNSNKYKYKIHNNDSKYKTEEVIKQSTQRGRNKNSLHHVENSIFLCALCGYVFTIRRTAAGALN